MGDIAIRVENLGKRYRIGETVRHDMLRETIVAAIKAPYRFLRRRLSPEGRAQREAERELWALRNVSFEVERGSVVGIIGRNGAGKSTLLKILSRITEPTEGRAHIRGRVGSLLEVGTGFHQELSGRENVYLSGAILGMSKAEIAAKFDEIVDFSGVERFIDTPVKRYSSGMRVRLGFAVAAHLEPEVLIIDEVLAVGDVEFQKKCLSKMGQIGRGGRTVLFVSHNMQAISNLTERGVLLHQGQVVFDGSPDEAISAYLGLGGEASGSYKAPPSEDSPTITGIRIHTSEPAATQLHGKPFSIELDVRAPYPIDGGRVSLLITDPLARPLIHAWLYDSERPILRVPGAHSFACELPRLRLNVGRYFVTAVLGERFGGRRFDRVERVCPFEVVMHGRVREGGWSSRDCIYFEDFTWTCRSET